MCSVCKNGNPVQIHGRVEFGTKVPSSQTTHTNNCQVHSSSQCLETKNSHFETLFFRGKGVIDLPHYVNWLSLGSLLRSNSIMTLVCATLPAQTLETRGGNTVRSLPLDCVSVVAVVHSSLKTTLAWITRSEQNVE